MPISEIDAMKAIDETLTQIDIVDMRDRILRWAWAKFSSNPTSHHIESQTPHTRSTKKTQSSKKVPKDKTSPSILKDLNLKPSGKTSFTDFINEKKPSSNHGKSIAAVYYLQHILHTTGITANHVYTCFKMAGWRIPSDVADELQWVASQKRWLDTSNMSDIRTTTHGDNHVEHDLPKHKSKKE